MSKPTKQLKQKIKSGEKPVFGTWLTLGHPSIPEIMAPAGFEFMVIDMEHSALGLSHTQDLIRSIEGQGLVPIVRVSENNRNTIKQVMDLGAQGVIVPMILNAKEAKEAVASVRYPPEGVRGVGLARAQGYGFDFEGYKKWLKKDVITILLIEHIQAVNNLESILSVEGVDATLIGPYDLSASMGFPGEFERKDAQAALKQYEMVCRKLKKPMGFHVVHPNPKKIKELRKRGFSFFPLGFDSIFLGLKCCEVMKEVQKIK